MIRVTENLRKIRDLLAKAAKEAGRPPESVKLLAAAKQQSPETVLEAARAGLTDFGENFVQEGVEKIESTRGSGLTWHFIGHLQSNKTRVVAEHFDWVHTIDRLKIAERLNAQRPHYAPELNVCLQVNVDEEEAKSGARVSDVLELAGNVATLPRLKLRGLMCIPAVRDSFDEQREPFRLLRELNEQLVANGIDVDTLSMGMTADYRAAIFEGATMVRIGTALFGERAKKK